MILCRVAAATDPAVLAHDAAAVTVSTVLCAGLAAAVVEVATESGAVVQGICPPHGWCLHGRGLGERSNNTFATLTVTLASSWGGTFLISGVGNSHMASRVIMVCWMTSPRSRVGGVAVSVHPDCPLYLVLATYPIQGHVVHMAGRARGPAHTPRPLCCPLSRSQTVAHLRGAYCLPCCRRSSR